MVGARKCFYHKTALESGLIRTRDKHKRDLSGGCNYTIKIGNQRHFLYNEDD